MSKVITPITAQVATYDTIVPFLEVAARMEAYLDKAGTADTVHKLLEAKSREEWISLVNQRTEGKDFTYFWEFPLSRILKYAKQEGTERPGVIAYMFGNPSIAEKIMQYNPLAAYNIPPRFLLLEKPEGGTKVTYHLPSSVMMEPGKTNNPVYVAELKSLDAKFERMADHITAA